MLRGCSLYILTYKPATTMNYLVIPVQRICKGWIFCIQAMLGNIYFRHIYPLFIYYLKTILKWSPGQQMTEEYNV